MGCAVFAFPSNAAASATIANETNTLTPGSYVAYAAACDSMDLITISLSATGGYISFYVFNSYYYACFQGGQYYYSPYLPSYVNTSSVNARWTTPSSDLYYFVIKNTHPALSSTVTVTITEDPVYGPFGLAGGGVIVVVLVVGAIAIVAKLLDWDLGIRMRQRHSSEKEEEKERAVLATNLQRKRVPQARRQLTTRPCPSCGAGMPLTARYCAFCGSRLTASQTADLN